MSKVSYFRFKNLSGRMIAVDPCHNFQYLMELIKLISYDVCIGDWKAIVNYKPEGGIKSVRIEHTEIKGENTRRLDAISVDSGQIVFCDKILHNQDETVALVVALCNLPKMDWVNHSLFYNVCSYQTLTPEACGSIHYGFVTSTGGDGVFTMYGEYNKVQENEVYTAFTIQFE